MCYLLIYATGRGRACTRLSLLGGTQGQVSEILKLQGACHPCTALLRHHVWRRFLSIVCNLNTRSTESGFLRQPQITPLFEAAAWDFEDSSIHSGSIYGAVQSVCPARRWAGKKHKAQSLPSGSSEPSPEETSEQESPGEHITMWRRKWALVRQRCRGASHTSGDAAGRGSPE